MRTLTHSLVPTAAAVVVAFGLTACNRTPQEPTAGQQLDTVIAKVEQKTDQAGVEVKKDVNAMEAAGTHAVEATASTVKDAAITTGVNAELARDTSLSALKINVDTRAGHVALHGTAPSVAARTRATQLAQGVDGVVSVDNQLIVRSN